MMEVRDFGEICIFDYDLPWAECLNSGEEAVFNYVEMECYVDLEA